VGLALVSAGIFAAATSKLVDYSQTELVFSPGHLQNGTFTRLADRWAVNLTWRFENAGRLPYTIASFRFQIVVDNVSDGRPWGDPAKIATEVTVFLSFFEDRFTGPVVAPGGTLDRVFHFDVTAPADLGKIVASPSDGRFYVGVLEGQFVYYIADVGSRWIAPVPPSYTGV